MKYPQRRGFREMPPLALASRLPAVYRLAEFGSGRLSVDAPRHGGHQFEQSPKPKNKPIGSSV
jgi:hypothetical protein